MITTTIQGRSLAIHVDGIEESFIIAPLGGRQGQALTETFLNIVAGNLSPAGMDDVLAEAVGPVVYERIREELSLHEAESVLLPAFYWQTVLGLDGVNAYISGGEGLAGSKKALELLILTLGISPTQTAPSTALESLIQKLAPTPPTGRSTTTVDRLPADKPRANRSPKKTRPAASPQ
ncbi:hypothetical protein QMG61_05240 [Cryobacterium sp. PH31-AA6]|uniref:hypothetical protein n=1 Tax=Cryobacterium sp. PH31-AA6 TaxID=3046205 RepID=UPI0024BAF013|nr:hypothetical protein [Cryobacterium sp. PH31-AA6]MDJ0323167.1 hypothetical protein [Cryobacterium sp. PH31-AA6]